MRCSVLAWAAALAATAGCSSRQPDRLDARTTALVDSVRASLSAYTRLSAEGKWDSVARFYAPDSGFRWVEEDRIVARSAAEIGKYLTALPPKLRILTDYQDPEITPIVPGVASVVTKFHTRFVDSAGTGPGFGGMLTMTWVDQGGTWRMLTGHSSSPGQGR